MTWDQVCGDFEAISLNWDPALYANTAIRHWWVISAMKPDEAEARESGQGEPKTSRLS
jgi:calpain-7